MWLKPSRRRESAPPPAATSPGHGEFDQVAAHYDALMSRVPYARWVDYVERLVDSRRAAPRRVLDLACGTGQVGAEFLRRGYQVLGADLSAQMAHACATQRPPLPVAVMDATRLGLRPASLDLVVCLYDSLNYVLDPEGLRECFRRVHEALAPEGLFIFDLNTPRALKIGLFTQEDLAPGARVQYRWEAHWDAAANICRVDMWFRVRGESGPVEFTETHYERAYPESEIKTWLRAAGFSFVRAYDAYTLFPVSPLAERMFFIAQV